MGLGAERGSIYIYIYICVCVCVFRHGEIDQVVNSDQIQNHGKILDSDKSAGLAYNTQRSRVCGFIKCTAAQELCESQGGHPGLRIM